MAGELGYFTSELLKSKAQTGRKQPATFLHVAMTECRRYLRKTTDCNYLLNKQEWEMGKLLNTFHTGIFHSFPNRGGFKGIVSCGLWFLLTKSGSLFLNTKRCFRMSGE